MARHNIMQVYVCVGSLLLRKDYFFTFLPNKKTHLSAVLRS